MEAEESTMSDQFKHTLNPVKPEEVIRHLKQIIKARMDVTEADAALIEIEPDRNGMSITICWPFGDEEALAKRVLDTLEELLLPLGKTKTEDVLPVSGAMAIRRRAFQEARDFLEEKQGYLDAIEQEWFDSRIEES